LLIAPDLAQQATAQAQQLCARLQEALEQQDADAAQALRAAAAQGDVATQAALARDGVWRDLTTRLDAMQAADAAAAQALATAYTRATTQRDLRGALEAVRAFDTRTLPRATALEVVKARIGLLQALLRRDDAAAGDRALLERQLAALGMEQERLARLGAAPAPLSPSPPSPPSPPPAAGTAGGMEAGGMERPPPQPATGSGGAAAGGLDLPDTAALVAQVARRAVAAASGAALPAAEPPCAALPAAEPPRAAPPPAEPPRAALPAAEPPPPQGGVPAAPAARGAAHAPAARDGGRDDSAWPFHCDSAQDVGAWSQIVRQFRRNVQEEG
jgi:hypothetical protein